MEEWRKILIDFLTMDREEESGVAAANNFKMFQRAGKKESAWKTTWRRRCPRPLPRQAALTRGGKCPPPQQDKPTLMYAAPTRAG